jgi:xylulokinase
LIAAVDCGTTAVKAALFDLRGRTVSIITRAIPCRHHADGRVEQDPRHIQEAVFSCLRRAMVCKAVRPASVAAIAVTNQRATLIRMGPDGHPLGPAIVWQDMRGAPDIEALRRRIADGDYYGITGLPNNAVFSLAKILHLKKTEPPAYKKTAKFVLVHDFVAQLLGGGDFVTDHSNASLTGMLDIHRRQWSERILEAAGIDRGTLPGLVPPGKPIGAVTRAAARRSGLLEGTPIIAGGGDQQCAGMGAGAVSAGVCSITLGTAGVCFCHTDRVVIDPQRRITCCAHAVAGHWNVEGLQHTAGDSVLYASSRWAGGRALTAAFLQKVAAVPPGAGRLVFLPFLAGAGAPHWRAEASGMLLGLRHPHDQAAMLRAVFEGVAVENRNILEVFTALKIPVSEIRLTGGYSTVDVWNQIQADLYGRSVATLENPQATLLGAAMLAACGVKAAASVTEAARHMVRVQKVFAPDPERAARYRQVFRRYHQLVDIFFKHGVFAALGGGAA